MKQVPAFAAVALVAVCPSAAFGQQAQQNRAMSAVSEITVKVCNETGDNARVALSYQPVNSESFYNEGWYQVPAYSCEDLVVTTNAYFYGYAEVENDGTRFWAGDHPLCVQYPGPYAFWSSGSSYCDAGQAVRNFVVMHAEQFGEYTWTLNPPD